MSTSPAQPAGNITARPAVTITDLKLAEEAKRERNWDPALRWNVMQETITWVAQQATVRRNTPEACLANQRRILDAMAKRAAKSQQ